MFYDLHESRLKSYSPQDSVKEWIDWCIDQCSKIDFGCNVDYGELKFSINNSTGYLGQFRANQPPEIIISSYSIDYDGEEETKNTILHELAHYIDYVYCIDNDFLTHRGDKLYKTQKGINFEKGNGKIFSHGRKWKEICSKIEKQTGFHLERTGSTKSVAHDKVKNNPKYTIRCKNCGNQFNRARIGDLENYTSRYICAKCGGKLEVTVNR